MYVCMYVCINFLPANEIVRKTVRVPKILHILEMEKYFFFQKIEHYARNGAHCL